MEARISRSVHDRQLAYPQPNESSLQLRGTWSSTSTLAQAIPPQLNPNQSDSSPLEMLNESTGPRGCALICTGRGSSPKCAFEPITSTNRTTDIIVDGESSTHERKAPVDTSNLAVRPLSRGHRVGYELSNPASTLMVRTEAISLHVSWEWDPSTCSLDHNRVHRPRWIEVEWLAPGNRLLDGNEDVECIDVDLLDSWTDKIIDSVSASDLRPVILKRGEHTVTLRWYHEDAPRSVE